MYITEKEELPPKGIKLDIYPRISGKTTRLKKMIETTDESRDIVVYAFSENYLKACFREYIGKDKIKKNVTVANINSSSPHLPKQDSLVLVDEPFFMSWSSARYNLSLINRCAEEVYMIGTADKLYSKVAVDLWFNLDPELGARLRNEFEDVDKAFREIEDSPIGLLSSLDELRVNNRRESEVPRDYLESWIGAMSKVQFNAEALGSLYA